LTYHEGIQKNPYVDLRWDHYVKSM
jgi:hypothetical protein